MSTSNDFGRKCVNKCNGCLGDALQILHSKLTYHQSEIISKALEMDNGALVEDRYCDNTLLSLMITLSQCTPEDKILLVAEIFRISSFSTLINSFFENSLSYEIIRSTKDVDPNWTPICKVILVTPNVLAKVYKSLKINKSYVIAKDAIIHYKRVNEPLYQNESQGLATFYTTNWGAMILDKYQDYCLFSKCMSKPIYAICAKHKWLLSNNDVPRTLKCYELFGYYLLLNDKTVPNNFQDFMNYIKSDSFTGIQNTIVVI